MRGKIYPEIHLVFIENNVKGGEREEGPMSQLWNVGKLMKIYLI